MKHQFAKYNVSERFDRVCILLRNGDWEEMRRAHPSGVSRWIRETVSAHCDYLRAKQRKAERLQREVLARAMSDPNL